MFEIGLICLLLSILILVITYRYIKQIPKKRYSNKTYYDNYYEHPSYYTRKKKGK